MINISDLAQEELNKAFPTSELPYTNINLEVTLEISNSENFTNIVNISSTKNIMKSVQDAAIFMADTWCNDVLSESDELSIDDLGLATIVIVDTPIEFTLKLEANFK